MALLPIPKLLRRRFCEFGVRLENSHDLKSIHYRRSYRRAREHFPRCCYFVCRPLFRHPRSDLGHLLRQLAVNSKPRPSCVNNAQSFQPCRHPQFFHSSAHDPRWLIVLLTCYPLRSVPQTFQALLAFYGLWLFFRSRLHLFSPKHLL